MTTPLRSSIDPNTGDRLYENGIDADKKFLSVTTVLGAIPKHFFLVPWAARLAAECAADEIDQAFEHSTDFLEWHYADSGYDQAWIEWKDRDAFVAHVKGASKRALEDAGDLGDDVHTAAEQMLIFSGGEAYLARQWAENTADLSDETRKRLGFLCDWLDDHDVRIIATEITVYNDEYGYAGSCDMYAIVDGDPYLLDIKTGKSAHAETSLQLTAYYKGEYGVRQNENGDVVEKFDLPWTGVDNVQGAVLHLQKTQMRFIPMVIGRQPFILFVRLLQVKKAMSMLDDFMLAPTYNSKKAKKEKENASVE